MKMQYALTQVCEVALNRHEIEAMIRDNLKARGGEPSYDFAEDEPIFVWGDKGDVAVRYVQRAVFAREPEKFRSLKPVPTRAEIDEISEKRRKAAAA